MLKVPIRSALSVAAGSLIAIGGSLAGPLLFSWPWSLKWHLEFQFSVSKLFMQLIITVLPCLLGGAVAAMLASHARIMHAAAVGALTLAANLPELRMLGRNHWPVIISGFPLSPYPSWWFVVVAASLGVGTLAGALLYVRWPIRKANRASVIGA